MGGKINKLITEIIQHESDPKKKYFIEYYFTLPNVLQFIAKFDKLRVYKEGCALSFTESEFLKKVTVTENDIFYPVRVNINLGFSKHCCAKKLSKLSLAIFM